MAAGSRKISPKDDDTLLITRKDMWIRRLEFIIEMTSGVVYSTVMHSLIITGLIFQILYAYKFDSDMLAQMSCLCFIYLMMIVAEVAVRWFCEEPMAVAKAGHFGHLGGTIFLVVFFCGGLVPLNPIEAIGFSFFGALLVCWTFFILLASFIPLGIAFQEDRSL